MAVSSIKATDINPVARKHGIEVEIARLKDKLTSPTISPQDRTTIISKLEGMKQRLRELSV